MTNRLLDSLASGPRDRLLSVAKHVPLPVQTVLAEAGEVPPFVYFPTSGIASVVIELAEGGIAEVAIIGREGMAGALQLLGPAPAPTRTFMQMEGSGYRIPFGEMRKAFLESEGIRRRVLELVQQQSLTISQLAACNKLHETEARLARWLLMVQDRVQTDTLKLTQQFLSEMLGTQRTTVVLAAGAFQRSGVITYTRGKITILSRENLEEAACSCYVIIHQLFDELFLKP